MSNSGILGDIFPSGGGGATLPIKLTTDVSEILPFANGGAGGIGINHVPFSTGGGVFTSSADFSYNPTTHSFKISDNELLGTDAEIIVHSTSNSKESRVIVEGGSHARVQIDKGLSQSNALLVYSLAGVDKWVTGMARNGSGSFALDYSVKRTVGGDPDFIIRGVNGFAGFGTGNFNPATRLHAKDVNCQITCEGTGTGTTSVEVFSAMGSAALSLRRGDTGAAKEAVVNYFNTPVSLKWKVGMLGGDTDYNIQNSGRGSAPDFRILSSDGNVSFGLSGAITKSLVVNRVSGTCGIEARAGVAGISEVNSVSGADATMIISRGQNTKEALLYYKDITSTVWVAGLDGSDDYELKNGPGGGVQFKAKVNGNFGFNNESFQGGVKVMAIANATTEPTSNPVGGVIFYSFGGVLKVRDSSGIKTVQVA